MNLYIDTATSDRLDKDPRMVRLAWLAEDTLGGLVGEACHLIRMPTGERMASEAAHYTGIYDHVLAERGMGLADVLTEFADMLGTTELVVGHSWEFQRKMLDKSFEYVGMPKRTWPDRLCTMIAGTNIVAIPRQAPGGGYKWPSFDQCCLKFRGSKLPETADPVAAGIQRVRAVRDFYMNIVRVRSNAEGLEDD